MNRSRRTLFLFGIVVLLVVSLQPTNVYAQNVGENDQINQWVSFSYSGTVDDTTGEESEAHMIFEGVENHYYDMTFSLKVTSYKISDSTKIGSSLVLQENGYGERNSMDDSDWILVDSGLSIDSVEFDNEEILRIRDISDINQLRLYFEYGLDDGVQSSVQGEYKIEINTVSTSTPDSALDEDRQLFPAPFPILSVLIGFAVIPILIKIGKYSK